MKIGIIGAGNIGGTLARKLAAAGHEIRLANSRGPDSLRELASGIGVNAVSPEEAVKDVEAIILSIPFSRLPELAGLLEGVPDDVVVIDTSNYYPMRDGRIAELDEGGIESLWVRERLGRPVVKAWNAVLSDTLAEKGLPRGTPGRIAIPIAGDDDRARAIAIELVDATGLDALDAGALSESWRLQPGTPAYCTYLTLDELPPALADADRARAPDNRDAIVDLIIKRDGTETHEERVAQVRATSGYRRPS